MTARVLKEFNEKHKAIVSMFVKIKADCENLNTEKEQALKN